MLNEPVLFLLWSSSIIVTLTLAMAKDRHPVGWLVVAMLSGPVAVGLLLWLRPIGHYAAIVPEPEAMELCACCCEPVRRDRISCRYCGVA